MANSHLENACASLKKKGLDGLITSSSPNISYLTGFTSRESCLLISRKGNFYFTDPRFTQEAKKSLKKIAVVKQADAYLFKAVADTCNKLGLKQVGFEEKNLSFQTHKSLREALSGNITLIATSGLIEDLRKIKGARELEKIKIATAIAIRALNFAQESLACGRREIEVAGDLERFIRYNGGYASAFDIIVASGINSCYPHHITSQKKIKDNELVLIDIGVDYQGYKSDLTRVYFLSKISFLAAKIYAIVQEAQHKAIQKIKPGASTCEIDAAGRDHIVKKGYGRFFSHSLGHGIGLEVHEKPRISFREEERLQPGMVFTVEPAIYLPAKFGIRIEDMVAITPKGCEVLSGPLHK